MTYKEMNCTEEERARRQEVCARINILYTRKQGTDDQAKRKRIDKAIKKISRTEAPWMKEVAFFLY